MIQSFWEMKEGEKICKKLFWHLMIFFLAACLLPISLQASQEPVKIEEILSERIVRVDGRIAFTKDPFQQEEFFKDGEINDPVLIDLLKQACESEEKLEEIYEAFFEQLEQKSDLETGDQEFSLKTAISENGNILYYLQKNSNRISTLAAEPLFEIQVTSSLPEITDENPNYSLEGLKYTIYKDSTGRYPIVTLTTDKNGYASVPVSQILAVTPSSTKYGYTVKNDVRTADYPNGTLSTGENDFYLYNRTTTTYLLPDLIKDGYKLERTNTPVTSAVYTLATKYSENQKVELIEVASLVQDKLDTNAFPSLANMWLKAEFYTSYDGSGKPARTWYLKTDEKGIILFREQCLLDESEHTSDPFYLGATKETCLPLGSLKLQEIKAPSGFYLPENRNLGTIKWKQEGFNLSDPNFTPKEIWVISPENKDEEDLAPFPGAEMLDELIHVTLIKKDESGAVLPGVEFEWSDPDGKIRTLISGDDGVLRCREGDEIYRQNELYGLAFGKHTFRETKAPEPYGKDLISFALDVDENGVTLSDVNGEIRLVEDSRKPIFELINKAENKYSLEVEKTDDQNKPLFGVIFELYREDELVGRETSDKSGILSFSDLKHDIPYTLKETGTPQGYKPLDEISFVIRNDQVFINGKENTKSWARYSDQKLHFHLVNVPMEIEELPETGSFETLFVFGAAAFLFGLYLLLGKKHESRF